MLNVKCCMILHLRMKSLSIPVLFVHSSFREWAEEICRNHYVLSCSARPKATKGARDNTTSKYGHVTRIHAQTLHLQLPFHQRIHQRCWRSVDSEHYKSLQAIRSYQLNVLCDNSTNITTQVTVFMKLSVNMRKVFFFVDFFKEVWQVNIWET